jgi:hypothetical protein
MTKLLLQRFYQPLLARDGLGNSEGDILWRQHLQLKAVAAHLQTGMLLSLAAVACI